MQVVDSHTEGEPTRLIIAGGPELQGATMAARRRSFARDFDHVRRFAVLEPRGHDALVGALLTPPERQGSIAGAIFFNNAGFLGMCGHAAIGTVVSLAHLGRIGPGLHRLDTPVGSVTVRLADANTATVENVPSFVHRRGLALDLPEVGTVTGDVAWGGNWFFIVDDFGLDLSTAKIRMLTDLSLRIRDALRTAGIRGKDGAEIDHIELTGPSPGADSRNFVLCPGDAYDRSPCGTGTSAKLACLHAAGKLGPGVQWVQESVTGGRFVAAYRETPEGIVASITGRAFVMAEAVLVRCAADPFADGMTGDAAALAAMPVKASGYAG